jgi:hypothetical protein
MWLRHYSTGRKVAGSISTAVTGFFFNVPNPSSRNTALEVDPTSNRNEYQEFSWSAKSSRRIRLTTSPPSVSRLSTKCGILDVSQPFTPSWLVKIIALLYYEYIAIRNHKANKQTPWPQSTSEPSDRRLSVNKESQVLVILCIII